MAFGILEDVKNPSPPGTSLLENVGRGTATELVLVPQPSSSPSDPLNWSRIRKELIFLIIVIGTCGVGVIGPVLVPAFAIIAEAFTITLTKVSLLNGSLILGLGVSSYICTCLAPIYGKRLIYLLTTLVLVLSSIWGAASKTYGVLVAARVFQGLGMGGYFAIAGTSSINDIFFVHQRGFRVGLWNMASIVSINIAPIISACVIVDLSWPWAFWLLAIFFGLQLVLVLVFFPETTFKRQHFDVAAGTVTEELTTTRTHSVVSMKENVVTPASREVEDEDTKIGHFAAVRPRWRLLLGLTTSELNTDMRVWRALLTPLTMLQHPAVIWSCLMWSVVFSWVIISASVAQQIFGAPPYSFSPTALGNFIGIAPFIGSILGTGVGGWFCDFVSKRMAAKNDGVYEPEFRLLVFIPFLITWIIGSYGLGMALHHQLSWIVCGVFLAILAFAVGVGCTGIVAYSNDVCQARAGESFGITMLIKSLYAFGLTFMLNNFYASAGPLLFMVTWGTLTVGVTMLTIPLYVYGKKIRAYSHRAGILLQG